MATPQIMVLPEVRAILALLNGGVSTEHVVGLG